MCSIFIYIFLTPDVGNIVLETPVIKAKDLHLPVNMIASWYLVAGDAIISQEAVHFSYDT